MIIVDIGEREGFFVVLFFKYSLGGHSETVLYVQWNSRVEKVGIMPIRGALDTEISANIKPVCLCLKSQLPLPQEGLFF